MLQLGHETMAYVIGFTRLEKKLGSGGSGGGSCRDLAWTCTIQMVYYPA